MNQPSETTTKPRAGVTPEVWENYARRVNMCSHLMAGILQMLVGQPMIASMVDPQFIEYARECSTELEKLTNEAENA